MNTFFPRGDGPLVSVLIPSRGRPTGLRKSVESLLNNADDPRQIEILVRYDDDDEETRKETVSLSEKYPLHVFRGPRGKGYGELHKYVNEMAAVAKGDWLFLFNDDSEVVTKTWDIYIQNVACYNKPMGIIPDVCLLRFNEVGDPASYSFVALRRKAYEILGEFSPYLHCDLWLFTLFAALDAVLPVPSVSIVHHQEQVDQTMREGRDAAVDKWRELKTWGALRWRLNKLKGLVEHIGNKIALAKWEKEPSNSGWWWWRKNYHDIEKPMLVFADSETKRVWMGGNVIEVESKRTCVGPAPGSDRESKFYNISELGGEWSKIV